LTMQRFGEKLRVLRTRRGMSMRDLARVFGYAGSGYMSELESGKKTPTTDFVVKAAKFFNVTTDQLLLDEIDLH